MPGDRKPGRESGIGLWRAGDGAHRDHASPDVECVVFWFVERAAGPGLDRGFGQRQGQHCGCGHLLAVRLPRSFLRRSAVRLVPESGTVIVLMGSYAGRLLDLCKEPVDGRTR